MVMICESMHWTYDQYLDNPTWFNEMLFAKMQEDNKEEKK